MTRQVLVLVIESDDPNASADSISDAICDATIDVLGRMDSPAFVSFTVVEPTNAMTANLARALDYSNQDIEVQRVEWEREQQNEDDNAEFGEEAGS